MHNQRKAYLYALGTVLLWSTVSSAFKLSLRHMDPLQLLLYASLASTVVLGTILAAQGRLFAAFRLTKREFLLSLGIRPAQSPVLLPSPVQGLRSAAGPGGPAHQLYLGHHPDPALHPHSGAAHQQDGDRRCVRELSRRRGHRQSWRALEPDVLRSPGRDVGAWQHHNMGPVLDFQPEGPPPSGGGVVPEFSPGHALCPAGVPDFFPHPW